VETLRRLKALGVQLAIDDFGTGYSSLAYLRLFPIDVLKIDRTFVSSMNASNEDASIIDAVVSLGHALNLSVVGEGVETENEALQLAALGCDLGQGYYFSRPMPREGADRFIEHARLVGRAAIDCHQGVALRPAAAAGHPRSGSFPSIRPQPEATETEAISGMTH